MNYMKLVFNIDDQYQEHFIAELMDMDFYGFEQFDDCLIAYVEKPRYNDSNREYIEQLLSAWPDASFREMEEVKEQNWNETWEKSIKPQRIGNFLVKPTWSTEKAAGNEILLEIDPKMSFGTGYHATTRLMLNYMCILDFDGKSVLDAGTGTGILAIAAIKSGAINAFGFDIDSRSEQNAVENVYINKVKDRVEIRSGDFSVIDPGSEYDVTLANINRNVILEFISVLVEHTKAGGDILLSGLLVSDEDMLKRKLQNLPVTIANRQQEEEWILLHLIKNPE